MGKKGKAKKQNHSDEQKHEQETGAHKEQQVEHTNQNEGEQKKTVEILQPKKIQYCPICTFPFQLCKYGKKASECKKFLMEIAPTKVSKYHPDENVGQKTAEGADKKQKMEKAQEQPQKPKQPKKQKTVKDKYILISVKNRDKKKFTSEVSGLSNFGVDSKELSKKLCKKFACSCSATDADTIVVQGDFFEDIKEILVADYKVKKKYILDKDEYKEKVGEEKEKKKEQMKKDKNIIPEEPEHKEDQNKEPEAPKFKNKMQQALADLDDEDQQQQANQK